MNETKEKTVPARKTSPGPAGLDGVLIDSCAFTESVGKKEPRPPLHCAIAVTVDGRRLDLEDVFLAVPAGRVLVKWAQPPFPYYSDQGESEGDFFSGPPKGPAYTGPITPAMWAIIRRHWNP